MTDIKTLVSEDRVISIADEACSESQQENGIFGGSSYDCAKRAARIALSSLSPSREAGEADKFTSERCYELQEQVERLGQALGETMMTIVQMRDKHSSPNGDSYACGQWDMAQRLFGKVDAIVSAALTTPPASSTEVSALKAEVERLREENNSLIDENSDLRDEPWPAWASAVLNVIRGHSGYDGYDDAIDGVDLPSELGECFGELVGEAERQTSRAKKAEAEVERLRKALEKIERWFGEFPETGRFWKNDDGSTSDRPMSYGAAFGSNGERDFMRSVARAALHEVEEASRDGLSPWLGWDQSNLPWSDCKHKDAVCEAVFRQSWSIEDQAMLIGFIERTWPRAALEVEEG